MYTESSIEQLSPADKEPLLSLIWIDETDSCTNNNSDSEDDINAKNSISDENQIRKLLKKIETFSYCT